MEKFIVSAKQKDILINMVLKDHIRLKDVIASSKTISDEEHFTISLSKDDADKIRDLCAETLQKIGFDKNYEPTNEGQLLEELIDLLHS